MGFFADKKRARADEYEDPKNKSLDEEASSPRTKIRADKATAFDCFRCNRSKKPKFRYEWLTSDGRKIVCNGCHGLLCSRQSVSNDVVPAKKRLSIIRDIEEENPRHDGNSIYVGQVDYSTTVEELLSHFKACGTIERVTIACDKYTGNPKGYAYIEFKTEASVVNALKLEGSELKGRKLKVNAKRVNIAGYNYQQSYEKGGRGGRGGRGGHGLGMGRGRGYRGGFRGGSRGRGKGFHPYSY